MPLFTVFVDEPKLPQQFSEVNSNANTERTLVKFQGIYYNIFVDTLNNFLTVYKSADEGAIWAECDAGNRRTVADNFTTANSGSGSNWGWETASMDIHPTNGEFYVAYIGTDFRIHISTFDMNTEAWSADIGGGFDFTALRTQAIAIPPLMIRLNYRLKDDKFIVVHGPDATTGIFGFETSWSIVTCTRAGVWGTDQVLDTPLNTYTFLAIVTFSTATEARTLVLIRRVPTSGTYQFWSKIFKSDDTLTGKTLVWEVTGPNHQFDEASLGKPIYLFTTNEFFFAFIWKRNRNLSGTGFAEGWVYGARTPYSDTVTWSVELITDSPSQKYLTAAMETQDPAERMIWDATVAGYVSSDRDAPWWDVNTGCFFFGDFDPNTLYVMWVMQTIDFLHGAPDPTPEGETTGDQRSIWYSKFSLGAWTGIAELIAHLAFDPASDDRWPYHINLPFRLSPAPARVAGMLPQYRRPRFPGARPL